MAQIERLEQKPPSRELALLCGIAAVFISLWAFMEIVEESREREHAPLEARILQSFRQAGDPAKLIGPSWLGEVAREVSALGGAAVTVLLTVFAAGHLLVKGDKLIAGFVIFAVVGGAGLNSALKHTFNRPRPGVVPYLGEMSGPSFPSGHSMISVIVYLTLGALIARSVEGWSNKVCVIAIGGLLSGLIGLSRVMLGVHYPTDVAAGWAAGACWALLCWIVTDLTSRWSISRRRRQIA
jgi:undecaprenyl-diphosphatase